MATTDPISISTATLYVRPSYRFLFCLWQSLPSGNLQNFNKNSLILEISYRKAKKGMISQCIGPPLFNSKNKKSSKLYHYERIFLEGSFPISFNIITKNNPPLLKY